MDLVRGISFHTFSIMGRCPRTGALGVGITTRSMAVASRCPYVQANIGAVATQASTNPRLGRLALRLLEQGFSAPKVLEEVAASDPYIEHRQIGIVDRDGNSAARTGSENKDWAGHITGRDYVAMGNVLLGEHVAEAIARGFEESEDEVLEERLLRAIEAGRDAGGQHGGQRSSGLVVFDREVFSRTDLRVDLHDEPVGELRRVYNEFAPLMEYFTLRAADPTIPSPEAQ